MVWVKKPNSFGGGFGSVYFAVPPVRQAWVLVHKGTASDDVVALHAAFARSIKSSRSGSNASCSSRVSVGEVLPAHPTIGRVHRSVAGSFMPVKIMLPLYLTTHFLLSNLTVHPASVSTRIPNREAIDSSGTMCPTSVVGRPGIIMSHMCVDMTRRPSANATFNGHVVLCLLWTGIPSMTKIWVAPESAIASFDAIVIAAYAHFAVDRFLGEANEENADC